MWIKINDIRNEIKNMRSEIKSIKIKRLFCRRLLVFPFLSKRSRDFASGRYWPLATMSLTPSLLFLMMSMFAVAHAEPLQGKRDHLQREKPFDNPDQTIC